MRVDKDNLKIQLAWGLPALAMVLGLGGWYTISAYQAGEWLGGGSLPGLVCGIVAGAIIAFEMLLWPRKLLRAWRLIAARHWMAAHLWFGLASWPIAVFHSGFHFGGLLPTLFIVLFTLTILSGLYGWLLQNIIPKMLFKQVTAETICSQIGAVSQCNVDDAYAMLISAFGPPPNRRQESATDADEESRELWEYRSKRKAVVVVGATRDVGRIRGRTLRTATVQVDPKHAENVWQAYYHIMPFLLQGRRADEAMGNDSKSSAFFANLRRVCGSDCSEIINSLEEYCNQRRQFDIQQRLHNWLHAWLPVHIGLSVAVSVLLIGHIITALRYW